MFVNNKLNCISKLNNDYINAIPLTLSFKKLIFEINFFWDSNINRIFVMNKDYTRMSWLIQYFNFFSIDVYTCVPSQLLFILYK